MDNNVGIYSALMSVIIVHFHNTKRLALLQRCLQQLTQQTYRKFELVLVCDNMSQLPCEIEYIISSLPYKLDVSLRRRGAAWCRKIGVELASGKYVAFIDDDAVPKDNWLEEYLILMENTELVGVGGRTLSATPKTRTQMFADLDESQRIPLMDGSGNIFNISTVNACFLRSALSESGVIHEYYVIFARMGHLFWFEDYDITHRLMSIYGIDKLGIAEKAVVEHMHRTTLYETLRQYYGYGKGAAFWLWCYQKPSNELKGGQVLPKNISNIYGHIIQVIKAVKCYSGHYSKARAKRYSILLSLCYATYGWLMRCSFHLGTLIGSKILIANNWRP